MAAWVLKIPDTQTRGCFLKGMLWSAWARASGFGRATCNYLTAQTLCCAQAGSVESVCRYVLRGTVLLKRFAIFFAPFAKIIGNFHR